jgi:hypothetical protein
MTSPGGNVHEIATVLHALPRPVRPFKCGEIVSQKELRGLRCGTARARITIKSIIIVARALRAKAASH